MIRPRQCACPLSSVRVIGSTTLILSWNRLVTATSLFVPGRLCLFGEHSDWAGGYRNTHPDILPGYCLAVGTTQGIHARIAANPMRLAIDSHGLAGVTDSCKSKRLNPH